MIDWSPSGILLRVEGRRTVRRALDSLLLTGDDTPCRLQLDPLVSEGRLRAAVVRARRRGDEALHLGIRFDKRATPLDCLRRWACWFGEQSTRAEAPSSATGRHSTQRLSKDDLPTYVAGERTPSRRESARSSARAAGFPAAEAGTAVLPAPSRPSARLEPLPPGADAYVGHTVGPCLVQERLGEGTFGRVYRALHLRLQQPVALKILSRATVKGNELSRFELEAKAAACLSDPNVAKVYELGEDVEGRPFIVQELVEGETLHRRVERMGPLPLDEVAKLGAGIASGLLSIHRANMVHRDLKPENVMITQEDAPKIVDFGLVRRIGDEAEFTPEGLLLGTPAFLAPEQIEKREAGHAREADLYAFGCVLFYALTGRVPHMQQDPSGETLTVFLYRRLSTEAPDVRQLRAGVPEPLARLVGALLSTDPAQRCTASQAQAILAELAAGYDEPLDLQPQGAPTPPKGSSGRRRSLSSSGRVRRSSSRRVKALGSGRRGGSSTRLVPVKRASGSSTRLDPHSPSRRLRARSNVGSGRGRAPQPSNGPAVLASVGLAAALLFSFAFLVAGGEEPTPGRAAPAATAQEVEPQRTATDEALDRLASCDPVERPAEALRMARSVQRAFPGGPVAQRASRLRREASRALEADCERALRETSAHARAGRWRDALERVEETQRRHPKPSATLSRLRARERELRDQQLEALGADMLRLEAALLDDQPAEAGALFAAALETYGKEEVKKQVEARLAASGAVADERAHAALQQLAERCSR